MTGANEEGTTADKPVADKPMFIYVADETEADGFDRIEKVVLDDNKVLVGMHAFRCVKMSASDVQDDPLLADEGKELPRFIFVSRDYSKIKVVEGSKIKAKNIFDQMSKFAKKEYGVNLKKRYKDTMKVLNEFDKINSALKTMKAKRARGDLSKSDEKKMAKEESELTERQKKADEMRDKLLTFKVRSSKA